MYSEALNKHINRPKWQTWLGVAAIFLVWFFVIKGSAEGYSNHPAATTFIVCIVNGAMVYITLFMIQSYDSVAKEIDRELGKRIEGLDYELGVLTEKYVALQQEHAKLLKQNSTL